MCEVKLDIKYRAYILLNIITFMHDSQRCPLNVYLNNNEKDIIFRFGIVFNSDNSLLSLMHIEKSLDWILSSLKLKNQKSSSILLRQRFMQKGPCEYGMPLLILNNSPFSTGLCVFSAFFSTNKIFFFFRILEISLILIGLLQGLTEDGVGSIMAGCKNMTELNISWTDLSTPGLDILCSTAPRGLERICLAGYRDTLQEPRTTKLYPFFRLKIC